MVRKLKLIVSTAYYMVWRLWRFLCWVAGRNLPTTCVVLYYHAVPAGERKRFAHQMDQLIQIAKPIKSDIDIKEPLKSGVHHAAITFDDGFVSVIENALPELEKRKIPFTIFIPVGNLGRNPEWFGEGDFQAKKEVVMSVSQLQGLPFDLVSIGSHTMTHSKVPLLGEEDAKREIFESKKELEGILGRKIRVISFPYGEYNQRIVNLARQAGYQRVFTILPSKPFCYSAEYVTGRVSASPEDSHLEFRLKLLGAYQWLALGVTLKRTIRSLVDRCFGRVGVRQG
jgi:peptidoglycan/xylan/chitin deacetylase (PgdA/CDA1 family)